MCDKHALRLSKTCVICGHYARFFYVLAQRGVLAPAADELGLPKPAQPRTYRTTKARNPSPQYRRTIGQNRVGYTRSRTRSADLRAAARRGTDGVRGRPNFSKSRKKLTPKIAQWPTNQIPRVGCTSQNTRPKPRSRTPCHRLRRFGLVHRQSLSIFQKDRIITPATLRDLT
jgi:hypothetical protein